MKCKRCNREVTEKDVQIICGVPFCKPCSHNVTKDDVGWID